MGKLTRCGDASLSEPLAIRMSQSSGGSEQLPPDIQKQIKVSAYVFAGSTAVFVWDILNNLPYPLPDCETAYIVFNIFYPISVSGAAFLFFLRVRAIFQGERMPTIIFGCLWLAVLASSIGRSSIISGGAIGLGDPTVCVVAPHTQHVSAFAGLAGIVIMVHDTIVFFAISYVLIALTQVEQQAPGEQVKALFSGANLPAFSKSLFMDGQMYYMVAVVANIVATVMAYVRVSPVYHGFLVIPNVTLTSIMACRVYRNTKLGVTHGNADLTLPTLNTLGPSGNTIPLRFVHFSGEHTGVTGELHAGANDSGSTEHEESRTDIQLHLASRGKNLELFVATKRRAKLLSLGLTGFAGDWNIQVVHELSSPYDLVILAKTCKTVMTMLASPHCKAWVRARAPLGVSAPPVVTAAGAWSEYHYLKYLFGEGPCVKNSALHEILHRASPRLCPLLSDMSGVQAHRKEHATVQNTTNEFLSLPRHWMTYYACLQPSGATLGLRSWLPRDCPPNFVPEDVVNACNNELEQAKRIDTGLASDLKLHFVRRTGAEFDQELLHREDSWPAILANHLQLREWQGKYERSSASQVPVTAFCHFYELENGLVLQTPTLRKYLASSQRDRVPIDWTTLLLLKDDIVNQVQGSSNSNYWASC
ncbi:hypothetical protein C8F04DRAFT_1260986 [Mycena alexandri]|uniref:Uncharacterized protein n=1 Tax=Mycena alexandri TaxID=1745969 RepID=A0AAD6SVJ1_9AGAR|nr:hypothetical protein C8F04DRAFT_1260986 [Mycena alexandri]